jgi:hypothetical protein
MRNMNETAQDMVRISAEEHKILFGYLDGLPKTIMNQLCRNKPLEHSSTGITIVKNFSVLNVRPPLLEREMTRSDFFETGAVDYGFHYKAEAIYMFVRDNEYGGVVQTPKQSIPLYDVLESIALMTNGRWSVFDDRIWFEDNEDADRLSIYLTYSY